MEDQSQDTIDIDNDFDNHSNGLTYTQEAQEYEIDYDINKSSASSQNTGYLPEIVDDNENAAENQFEKIQQLDKLNKAQIEVAHQMIKVRHRLFKTPLERILPTMRFFFCCGRFCGCCKIKRLDKVSNQPQQRKSKRKHRRQLSDYATNSNLTNSMMSEFSDDPLVKAQEEAYHRETLNSNVKSSFLSTSEVDGSLIEDNHEIDILEEDSRSDNQEDASQRNKIINKMSNYLKPELEFKIQDQNITDPFLEYGVGIVAYFRMQRDLIKLFAFLTIMSIPSVIFYNIYRGLDLADNIRAFSNTTLGNMGFPAEQCSRSPVDQDTGLAQVRFYCQAPSSIMDISDTGVLAMQPEDFSMFEVCSSTPSKLEQQEGYNETLFRLPLMHIDDNQYLNQKAIDKLYQDCQGETNCNTQIDVRTLFQQNQLPSTQNQATMQFFVKAQCKYSEDISKTQRRHGLIIACLTVFTSLIFSQSISYMQSVHYINMKIWDSRSIKASDYTVKVPLQSETFEEFKRSLLLEVSFETLERTKKLKIFKEKLSNFLEEEIRLSDEVSFAFNNYLIANIQFAFDNTDVLKLLAERGQLLKESKFQEQELLEQKLNHLKNINFEKYQSPVTAYITFQTEMGLQRALELDFTTPFYNQKIEMKRANDPEDIIWENRSVPKKKVRKNLYCLIAIIMALTLGMFFVIICILQVWCRYVSYTTPPPQSCDQVQQIYGYFLETQALLEFDRIEQDGMNRFIKFFSNKFDHLSSSGALYCYCENQTFSASHYYQIDYAGQQYDVQMCYLNKVMQEPYVSMLFSIYRFGAIAIVNQIMIGICIWQADSVGFHSESLKLEFLKNCIFYIQFMNIGVLIPIGDWNSVNVNGDYKKGFFQGIYSDYNQQWFQDIGGLIVLTLYCNACVLPFFMALMQWTVKVYRRMKDQGTFWKYPTNYQNTQTRTIYEFCDLYSGTEFILHLYASSILTIVFVSAAYSPTIPVMNVLTMLSIALLYGMQRFALAYLVRQPPNYCTMLTENCLIVLKLVPLVQCASAAYAFDNQQLFQNTPQTQPQWQDIYVSYHRLITTIFQLNPGIVLKILLIYLVFEYIIAFYLWRLRKNKTIPAWANRFLKNNLSDINLKTDYGPFFDVLHPRSKRLWLQEELICQLRLGIKRLEEDHTKKLNVKDIAEIPNKCYMYRVFSYDLLMNPKYQEKFLYVPGDMPNRSLYIVSPYKNKQLRLSTNDVVRMMVDLGYYTQEKILSSKIDAQYLFEEKPFVRDRQTSLVDIMSKYQSTVDLNLGDEIVDPQALLTSNHKRESSQISQSLINVQQARMHQSLLDSKNDMDISNSSLAEPKSNYFQSPKQSDSYY